ncbi:DUF1905 domain-containing protein [Sphingopyxis lindanitolerans]|uniref:DUF1905 domain-containing protein n=1 Tax=Sphingopyxis lindanitolerans TaxID=2054227 RepID=A0A2S8B518_9SPHN|nr:DUF1905 domain-containing protein [Sphingopyxis lindanitolerans]PQM27457.1 DUF1905 domain-containing protein [Sphingopyxis lindanitolerans]
MEDFTVTTPLWRWQSATAPAAWFFVTIAGEAADGIRFAAIGGQWLDGRRGFGSAKVRATIGGTSWNTSVFPHRESGGWLLPVKAAVRKAEDLAEGDDVTVTVIL